MLSGVPMSMNVVEVVDDDALVVEVIADADDVAVTALVVVEPVSVTGVARAVADLIPPLQHAMPAIIIAVARRRRRRALIAAHAWCPNRCPIPHLSAVCLLLEDRP
jgi:hypothetical protein